MKRRGHVLGWLVGAMLAHASLEANSAERAGDSLVFRVPVLPQAARFLDLLAAPSYLALALEVNGLAPSASSRTVLREAGHFEIRTAAVRFLERSGPVFRYEGRLALTVSGVGPSINVPVEVDTAGVATGQVTVRVRVPLSDMIPSEVLDRIELKLRLLADMEAQRRTLAYLDEVTARGDDRSAPAVRERIVFDAYNRGHAVSAPARDTGAAEPLREQVALIATIAVWLVAVPSVFWWARRRQRIRHRILRRPLVGNDSTDGGAPVSGPHPTESV